jgi:hypothetical protein
MSIAGALIDLGFDPNQLGGYNTISEPVVAPTEEAKRTKVAIEGVTNPTVLNYMDNLNANDFDVLIELFTPDGALQPPFQRPIVGKESVLKFFKEEWEKRTDEICELMKKIP